MAVLGKTWAYVAIPKTACRAIQQWLVENCGGVKEPVAEGSPRKILSHHARIPPEKCKGRKVFTCVRHPFSRLVSYWRHTQPSQPFVEWLEYVNQMRRNGYRHADQFAYRSQSEYADLHPGLFWFRFEELPQSLWVQPFIPSKAAGIELPTTDKGEHTDYTAQWWRQYRSRKTIELALEHSGDDLDRFRYDLI